MNGIWEFITNCPLAVCSKLISCPIIILHHRVTTYTRAYWGQIISEGAFWFNSKTCGFMTAHFQFKIVLYPQTAQDIINTSSESEIEPLIKTEKRIMKSVPSETILYVVCLHYVWFLNFYWKHKSMKCKHKERPFKFHLAFWLFDDPSGQKPEMLEET